MRVVNQITFTAKDDAEALRLAAERLGRDAVILSTQVVKEGGVLGLFQRSVLKVTAGIIEEDTPQQTRPKAQSPALNMDEDTRRENLIAFQKLMEFKERSSSLASPPPPPPATTLGEEGYRLPQSENVMISPEGIRNAYGLTTRPAPVVSQQPQPPQQAQPVQQPPQPQPAQTISNDDAKLLRDQVGALADRIDVLLSRISTTEATLANVVQKSQPVQQSINHDITFPQPDSDLEVRLKSSDVDDKYIRKLLVDYSISARKDKSKKIPFNKWLAAQINCAADNGDDPIGGRKVMLLGPTGVGKTTTIAKLAAIKALWEHKSVLLLTADTYRIAAVEQLKTYAKILGVPIEIVFDFASIQPILNDHDNSQVVLLDTAGKSQRDKKNPELLENIYNSFAPDAVHLVLAANMKYKDMLDVVEHMPNIPVSHLLFTKLDETVSYGSIFNIQQVMGCPISFLTVGQNVPKDIETATGIRIADFLMKSEEERKR